MLNNRPRGISFNKNALNLQSAASQLQLAPHEPDSLDNLKAGVLSLENAPPQLAKHFNDDTLVKLPPSTIDKPKFTIIDENDPLPPRPVYLKDQQLKEQVSLKSEPIKGLQLREPQQQQPQPQQHQVQPTKERKIIDLPRELQLRSREPENHSLQTSNENHLTDSSVSSKIPRLSLKFQLGNLTYRKRPTSQVAAKTGTQESARPPLQLAPTFEEPDDELDEEIENIDKSNSRDAIFLVSDIAKDIYAYMYKLEDLQPIQEDFLRDQKIYTPKIRQRLVNWCIDIHNQLGLLAETLYMTIALMDRFFNKFQVKQQSQVQLVAVGATLIASKYEEIYPPDVNDLIHLTQDAYSRRDIMRIEIAILEQLNFELGRPVPLAFLRRFSKAAHCDLKTHSIAKYLMELSLCEYECSHWKPSLLAAAALYTTLHLVRQSSPLGAPSSLTRRPLGQMSANKQQQQQQQLHAPQPERWTKTLVHYTDYTRAQLQGPAGTLCKILKQSQKSPQSYYCVRKHAQTISKWTELKSARVDFIQGASLR